MEETMEMHTVLVRKSDVIKTLRCRWLDNIRIDLKKKDFIAMKIGTW